MNFDSSSVVDYTADPIHGFNAVVNREPLTKAVAVAQPVIAHQPAVIAAKTILPAQPLAYTTHAQPLAYAAQPVLHQAPLLAKAAYVH